MEKELLENSNGRQTEVAVAQGHKEVVFHLGEDLMPIVQVIRIYVSLRAGVKYLDVRPLEALKVLSFHDFLQGLGHEESIPFLRCAISAILLRV